MARLIPKQRGFCCALQAVLSGISHFRKSALHKFRNQNDNALFNQKTHTNMNANRNNSHEATATDTFDTSDSRTAVEAPITLRRPNPNGDGEIPTGSPPNMGAAKKRLHRTLAASAALMVALASGVYYFWFVLPYESTDNAFIEGNVIPMASQVPGRVAALLVKDNQAVKQGDVILKIDPRDYEASLAQARADLAAASSRVEQAKAQVNASEAKVAQAQATVVAAAAENQRAADDLKRYESVESSAVSRSAFDLAQSQARAAGANLEAARSQAKAAEAEVALSAAGVETASAAVQQAEARLQQAELNLSYTQVTAPDDGRVTRRVVEMGAYIQPGQALMAIVPRHYWVIANFKEIQLTHMRVGQPVEVVVDAYPNRTFKGHVESIQNGAGARFSLFPPENATGNYIKVVQRVPVKIILDDLPGNDLALGPGMSVVPKVRVK
jgi:membrane fusion protein (multidrug efflux system)